MAREIRYLFSLISVYGRQETRREIVEMLMAGNAEFIQRGYGWGVFEADTISIAGAPFAIGQLVKFRLTEEYERAERKAHTLTAAQIENVTKAKVRFFVDLGTGVVAHHRAGNDISASRFRSAIARLIEETFDGIFVDAFVNPVLDRDDFLEALGKFARVQKVNLTLHPTNPSAVPEYQKLDEAIKSVRASKYKEEYEAVEGDSEGLDVEHPRVRSGIQMAVDGYGEGRVTGEAEGERREIRTGDSPTSTAIPSELEDPESILQHLLGTFRRIARRKDR